MDSSRNKIFILFSVSMLMCNMIYAQLGIPSPFNDKNSIKNQKYFDITFDMKSEKESQKLVMSLDLVKDAYIISPFSQDSFYLGYTVTYQDADPYLAIAEIHEFPEASEEYDPFIEKKVKFVRVNSIYTQNIRSLTKEDFKVKGLVEFLMEPACIPYDVNFVITQKDGLLSVENSKPLISSEYKL